MRTRLRLADLLAGLSVASDLGFGLRPETAMRSCLVATGLARALDLPETEVADTFYTSLLFHVGCPAFSHETATLFGNELMITRAVARTNLADPADFLATLVPEATRGLPRRARDALAEPRCRLRRGSTRGRRSGPSRSARHRPAGGAHRTRDRGSSTRRSRPLEPRYRAQTRHLTPHCRASRPAHLREARGLEPSGGRALRAGARSPVTPEDR